MTPVYIMGFVVEAFLLALGEGKMWWFGVGWVGWMITLIFSLGQDTHAHIVFNLKQPPCEQSTLVTP